MGSGSIQHLAGTFFRRRRASKWFSVPYKGAAPATVDLIAGQVNTAFSGVGTVAALVTAGKLRALALTGKRMEVFEGVPTMQEAGVSNVDMWLWNGVLAPRIRRQRSCAV